MNLIIDSSIYAKDIQFKSESFLNLIHLGQLGHVNLIIPKTVHQERVSNEDQRIKAKLSLIRNNLKDLKRHGVLDSEIGQIEFRIFWFEKYYEEDLRTKWEFFIGKSQATFLECPYGIANEIMKAYFKGNRPYKSRKERKDIPDSFICEEIKNLL